MQADRIIGDGTSSIDFKALFESAPGLYLVLSPALDIVAVTDAYCAATMTRREEILGRGLFDVFPDNPEDPDATGVRNLRHSLSWVLQHRRQHKMAFQRYDIRTPQSQVFELRYWSPTNTPIFDAAGKVEFIVHQVEDVTELVKLQKADSEKEHTLREHRDRTERIEAELRLILNSVRVFLWYAAVAEVDGARNWNVRVSDLDAARRILPVKQEPGQDWTDAWRLSKLPEDRIRSDEASEAAFRAGLSRYTNEYRCRLGTGEIRWFFEDVEIVATGSHSYDIMGACVDVTELKQEEEKLKMALIAVEEARSVSEDYARQLECQAARLQEANDELEAFSYSVSHDLRAPLRHISGYVRILQQETEGTLTDEALRSLEHISAASGRMANLIEDLLAFARMGKVELEKTVLSLDVLVADAVKAVANDCGGRNIEWHISPLPKVLGDASMIRLVLVNLIGNAVKFTRDRDPARIAIGAADEQEGRIVFFVQDNGVGFDMKYAARLFGVFERMHRADEFEGTGIGLAMVRRIIVRHGGQTWAESTPGEGTTVYFSLAAASPR